MLQYKHLKLRVKHDVIAQPQGNVLKSLHYRADMKHTYFKL